MDVRIESDSAPSPAPSPDPGQCQKNRLWIDKKNDDDYCCCCGLLRSTVFEVFRSLFTSFNENLNNHKKNGVENNKEYIKQPTARCYLFIHFFKVISTGHF